MVGGGAGEVGVEGGLLGVPPGLRDVIDDATMNALFDLETKLLCDALRIKRWSVSARPDKLQPLPLNTTLCDPFKPCRSTAMSEPWVSVEKIAEHIGVTRDSIYRWIDRKSLPAHRVGRLWKFQISEVDEWVRAGGADEDSVGKKQ
jgi:excisionase family DNA binding protein